ncbi:MAG TPA: neutral/alkaline non-lysosomal ceramidase N-terminal domain-containing protein, partial [Mycobacteriales bacterium]|nr:neutral/alkaline non-lysosomal ceramidase N-terminal domain-containing protein [Mycobacteriales bacterium]
MRPRRTTTAPGARSRAIGLAVAACVLASPLLPASAGTAVSDVLGAVVGSPERTVRAGVGIVDATWNVGAAAGQYSDPNSSLVENVGTGGDVDPHAFSRIKEKSYGTHSRLTVRALVVEGTDGQRVALLKSDNYLAQDLLLRRVGQLLEQAGSGVAYDDILHAASHNHSSPYYTTSSPGVFVFQDAFDQRMFEYQARAFRDAIVEAEQALRPARMAAHTVQHSAFKANVVGPATADDGTPAGYPREYGDTGVVVMRFDELVPTPGGPLRPGSAPARRNASRRRRCRRTRAGSRPACRRRRWPG